jgi:hypothetical protein
MRVDITLPSFLFIGTAKAGTTSIANYLDQHPELRIPMKETFYFMREIYRNNDLAYPAQRAREEYILNVEQYEHVYQGQEGFITGEVGTGYLFHHKESIEQIKETLGEDVKILIVLRNPVERCYSSYRHFTKDLHEEFTFEEAIEKEKERAANDWDFMWQHRSLGCYADQVEAYQKAFKNVKVFIYEDLRKDPKNFMDEVFKFIGVQPLSELDTSKEHNPSGDPKSKTLQKFITHENPLKKIIRPVFRMFFSAEKRANMRKDMKARNLAKGTKMSDAMRADLRAFYARDMERLKTLIGRDLSEWN